MSPSPTQRRPKYSPTNTREVPVARKPMGAQENQVKENRGQQRAFTRVYGDARHARAGVLDSVTG
jgi:hypothetical protein